MTRTEGIRTALSWPQWKLAEHLGVSQPTVVRLEAGQSESGPIARLLDLLALQIGRHDLVLAQPAASSATTDAGGGP